MHYYCYYYYYLFFIKNLILERFIITTTEMNFIQNNLFRHLHINSIWTNFVIGNLNFIKIYLKLEVDFIMTRFILSVSFLNFNIINMFKMNIAIMVVLIYINFN